MVVVVDTGVANLRSISNALEFVGHPAVVTRDPGQILSADRILLPGVGAFAPAMQRLRAVAGLIEALNVRVLEQRTPVLGICLGFQLMARSSYEGGHYPGLGWLDADVQLLEPGDPSLKVPHVGFDSVRYPESMSLFNGIPQDSDFYFVHSYQVGEVPGAQRAVCHYGAPFSAAVQAGHIMGTQFHPEKSQKPGLTLLRNFLEGEGRAC